MAKKTKVIHGWAYKDEVVQQLMHRLEEDDPIDSILFAKQADAQKGYPIKRMTIRITIEDYHPKRPRLNAKDRQK